MKKIINGKLYNTETATEVCSWSNGYFSGDFRMVSETIFRKKTGEYFLYGWGGALSEYAETFGNNSTAGETIIPLTYDAFKEWALEKLSAFDYMLIFGEVSE